MPAEVADDLLRRAGDLRQATGSVAAGRHPVLLSPVAAADLARGLGVLFSGDLVLGDLRPLADRLGRRIASPAVTLVDDGALAGGRRSRPFDDEGTPTRRTVLLEKGRLREFLHTLETAARLECEPNGKAHRITVTHSPRPGPSNIYLAAGEATAAELRDEVSRGLLVTGFTRPGRVVSSTGRFTAMAYGQWREPGAPPRAVSRVPLSAGVFPLLRHIRGCGDDLRFSPLSGGAGAPTVLIAEMVVG